MDTLEEKLSSRSFRGVWLLLGGLLILKFIMISQLGLKTEEAYYWNYAQHPDWSYFDHPPMVAWLIASSTTLGDNSPFWVHLPAVLTFALLTVLVYQLGKVMFEPRVGQLAALLINFLPIFTVLSACLDLRHDRRLETGF